MTLFDAAGYFARRAPRYQEALRMCPDARALDLLPFVAALVKGGLHRRESLRVCDAFGGTGFLARALKGDRFRFVVCDCCDEMVASAASLPNVTTHVTPDDFASALETFGEESFDVVLSLGGLHHVVVDGPSSSVDAVASRLRQVQLVNRLAKLVRPGGALIIADIPDRAPQERAEELLNLTIEPDLLKEWLGPSALEQIISATLLPLNDQAIGFSAIREAIVSKLVQPNSLAVPRYFFDHFVATNTEMGHIAAYVDFDEIDIALTGASFIRLGILNYQGPWLFQSEDEAGWFFKEKFSVGESSVLGESATQDVAMYRVVRDMLGARLIARGVAVNWGVTYSAYQKGEIR